LPAKPNANEQDIGIVALERNADFSRRVAVHAAHLDRGPAAPHSAWNPHPMQGWSPDFIPKLTGYAVDTGIIHKIVRIRGAEGDAGARSAPKHRRARRSSRCWTGERYLSARLFADIPADMTDEELKIAASTPGGQLKPPAS
jgi:cysteine synthase A